MAFAAPMAGLQLPCAKWRSLANARAFFESKELVEIRRQAGVHAPEFIYLDSIEQGTL